MYRILASITTLEEHMAAIDTNAACDLYRPPCCPRCGAARLCGHGCYFRKADHSTTSAKSLNPVPILRYRCKDCMRTCSRLPSCIAPRRWYDWALQQLVLLMLLAGNSVRQCAHCSCRARSTVRRWRDWLDERGDTFKFWLCSRHPQLGGHTDKQTLWCHVMQDITLMQAMACCDRNMCVP